MAKTEWNQEKGEFELTLEEGEKLWTGIENGEFFTMIAKTEKEARGIAHELGGELIGEYKNGE